MNGPQVEPAGLLLYAEYVAEQERMRWAASVVKDEDFMVKMHGHCYSNTDHKHTQAHHDACADLIEWSAHTTLTGIMSMSVYDNLEYFQRKLFTALRVPKEYLGNAQ